MPGDHYREIRQVLRAARALLFDQSEADDSKLVHCTVYAPIYDAFVDNRKLLWTDLHVFHGHSNAEWQLMPSGGRSLPARKFKVLGEGEAKEI